MAMAAAWMGRRKIVPTLATTIMRRWEATGTVVVSTQKRLVNHCINGQNVRPSAAAAEYFIPHPRRYGTSLFSAKDMMKLSRSTGDYNYDLAVDKAIQHYHDHIKMEEEDGQSVMMYPLRGTKECLSGVQMFHILLETTGGQKYVSIYVAPGDYESMKLDDGALKLVFFRKVDKYVSLPLDSVIGPYRWPVSPRNDPLITAAARFALAQHNKEEKLAHLIRANSQMVWEHEIFRMTFKAEFSRNYDAIVLVPRKTPEKMQLVKFGISNGWDMYGRLLKSKYGSVNIVPFNCPIDRFEYEEEYEYESESESQSEFVYQYEDDEYIADDPRVTAAARFALAHHNEKDQFRRVVEATRRTYSGDEILSMQFDGELDGSRFYEAIVLAPVNDPENMRLAYVGCKGDDYDPDDPDDYLGDVGERFKVDEDGFDECSIDDPLVTEAARLALTTYNRKDKLLRVVKATSKNDSEYETYRVRFVGEFHPLRTYVALLYAPIKDPKNMQVEYVSPEV